MYEGVSDPDLDKPYNYCFLKSIYIIISRWYTTSLIFNPPTNTLPLESEFHRSGT